MTEAEKEKEKDKLIIPPTFGLELQAELQERIKTEAELAAYVGEEDSYFRKFRRGPGLLTCALNSRHSSRA